MKIAIFTLPLNTNYGGILQAFALQSVLKKMGHEVFVIDLQLKISWYRRYKTILKRIIIKYLLRQKNSPPVFPMWPNEVRLVMQHTQRFIQKNIHVTDKITAIEKLYKLRKYHFDAFIVGSDQVWRPQYSPNIQSYFLNFLGNSKSIKRIAYAASFGVENWEFNKKQTEKCKSLIQKFDAVSVREDSGVQLTNKYFGIKSVQLVDPTLLLNKEDYISLIISDNISHNKKTLMAYVLDKTDEKEQIIQRIVHYFNLSINSVMPSRSFSKDGREFLNYCVYPPVDEWIKGFKDASFVVTDSFHGTAFSIIFNKPFLVIGNKTRGMSRIVSLLKLLGLENRLVSSANELTSEFLNNPIDFSIVNKIKIEQQKISHIFLVNALKN